MTRTVQYCLLTSAERRSPPYSEAFSGLKSLIDLIEPFKEISNEQSQDSHTLTQDDRQLGGGALQPLASALDFG